MNPHRESEPAQLVRLLTDMGQARALPLAPAPPALTDQGDH